MTGATRLASTGFRGAAGERFAHSKRQSEILDALEELFLERGFRAVAVADMTSTARCSRTTLYELAPTKEEIFLLVLERMLWRTDQEGRVAAGRKKAPAARVEAYLTVNAGVIARAGVAFGSDVDHYKPAVRLLSDYALNGVATISEMIDDGIAAGEFRDVDSKFAAQLIVTMIQQTTAQEFLASSDLPWPDAVRDAFDLILYGLVGATERRGRRTTPGQSRRR